MKKVNRTITLLVIIVSVALIYTLSLILLDNTGKINQGKYRVNDAILTSTIIVEDKNISEEAENITEIVLDLSQTNTLSMLISKDEKYNKMYINNISVSSPKKKGNIYISQSGEENSYVEITKELKEIEIYPIQKDDQYFVELNFCNVGFLKEAAIPTETGKIIYDGTILKLLNIKQDELEFEVRFDFNIIDITGNKNTCKVKLKLPYDNIVDEGISVTKLPLSNFVFRAK